MGFPHTLIISQENSWTVVSWLTYFFNNLTTIQELEFDQNLRCIAGAIIIYYIIILDIVNMHRFYIKLTLQPCNVLKLGINTNL